MARLPTDVIMTLLLTTILPVFGCGVIPAGQASSSNFVVTGFTLPVAMVYTDVAMISAQHPGIASSRDGARAFVSRLVMQTVFDVLERNGRSALLPDTIISSILIQLNITVIYEPMQCQKVFSGPVAEAADMMKENCIIVGNTVTRICTLSMPAPPNNMCNMNVAVIPPQHLTIGGLITV
ncbi:hypothetical protein KIN20_031937 [Parelaphostrongylus tenuis]|uniref:Secreted protein n=1 Tax=Parelaphostrongylus tenuis TaxID=148309 RepID=A0AAD5R687_PARTN|nr:hypothetical protein KIN20_031937 [Parelaphostrongylus tenuis]